MSKARPVRYRYVAVLVIIVLFFGIESRAGHFDTTARLPFFERLETCRQIVRKVMADRDSAAVIRLLHLEKQEADQRGDPAMAAISLALTGDYYFARNDVESATNSYLEGIDIAHKYRKQILEAILNHDLGYELFQRRYYAPAFEYMLRADDQFRSEGYEQNPYISKYLYQIGYAYYSLHYYDKAIAYLKEGAKYDSELLPKYRILINNTLALTFQSMNREDSSYYYFDNALSASRQQQDSVWIGIISGNVGALYFRKKEYQKALPLLRLDYMMSLRYKEFVSASNCMLMYAEMSLDEGNVALAQRQLDTALVLADSNWTGPYNSIWQQNYYQFRARLLAYQGNMREAYFVLDTLLAFSKNLWRQNDALTLSQVEAKIALEKHLAQLRFMESERSRVLIRRNAIIIVLTLLVVIVLQALRRNRLKQKKDREIHRLGAERAAEEIQNARLLLASYTERLQKNSQMIEHFKKELELREEASSTSDKEMQRDTFDRLHSFTILTEEDWQEFKTLFSRVHTTFFIRLHDKHPDLTQAEVRFIALSKLGLSINEMSNALGVSADAVRKTRLRLRKKILVPEYDLLRELSDE